MPAGRPSTFTPEIAEEICRRLAINPSVRRLCQADDMPDRGTILRWREANADFDRQYARARETGLDEMGEEILDIADDGANDFVKRDLGDGVVVEQLNSEHIQRSRLRVDTRKWLLSKLAPKRYSERLEVTGAEGGPIETKTTNVLDDTSRAALIAALTQPQG